MTSLVSVSDIFSESDEFEKAKIQYSTNGN